jgi:hypothetical protein
MQRNETNPHTSPFDFLEQIIGEMQSRGWGRNRAGWISVHGLITFSIIYEGRASRSNDVRRQRHFAKKIQSGGEIRRSREAEATMPFGIFFTDRCFHLGFSP